MEEVYHCYSNYASLRHLSPEEMREQRVAVSSPLIAECGDDLVVPPVGLDKALAAIQRLSSLFADSRPQPRCCPGRPDARSRQRRSRRSTIMIHRLTDIPNGVSVMLDANVLVYAFTPPLQSHAVCRKLFGQGAYGAVSLSTSLSITADLSIGQWSLRCSRRVRCSVRRGQGQAQAAALCAATAYALSHYSPRPTSGPREYASSYLWRFPRQPCVPGAAWPDGK